MRVAALRRDPFLCNLAMRNTKGVIPDDWRAMIWALTLLAELKDYTMAILPKISEPPLSRTSPSMTPGMYDSPIKIHPSFVPD